MSELSTATSNLDGEPDSLGVSLNGLWSTVSGLDTFAHGIQTRVDRLDRDVYGFAGIKTKVENMCSRLSYLQDPDSPLSIYFAGCLGASTMQMVWLTRFHVASGRLSAESLWGF